MFRIGLNKEASIAVNAPAISRLATASGQRGLAAGNDELLFDVTRLVWRCWVGRLPTGIDRVCLAYLAHFARRACAVVQRGRLRLVLSYADSQALFALILSGDPHFRRKLLALAPMALARAALRRPRAGAVYLNIGHTGLDSDHLCPWVARHGLRPIYFVHDIIPITHPEFCREGEAAKHRRRMTTALSSAAGIIANSRKTLEDVARFATRSGLPNPPGAVAWLSGIPLGGRVTPANLGRAHFITIGTIEGRKNHILLLRLWKRMAQRLGPDTPKLVIVGQRGWEADHAIAMLDRCQEIREHVLELGRCEDDELARLIKGARALLMPSFIEGFGLPVIEALALGTPVLASNLPVFREIAGDIPTYCESHDGKGWEEAVLSFLGDCPERQRQIERIAQFRAPDWHGHFAQVERWLDQDIGL